MSSGQFEQEGNTPSICATSNVPPIVFVNAPADGAQSVRLARRLNSDEAQASLRAAAIALIQPPDDPRWDTAGVAPAKAEDSSGSEAGERYPSVPTSWRSEDGPKVVAEASDVGEIASAFFQPWLPMSGLNPVARLFHRLNSAAALAPVFFVAVGFAAAQLANNPSLLTGWLIGDAHAAATVLNVSPDDLRLYIQLGLFLMAALVVVVTFIWSLFAASSKKPRIAAFGTKVFSQVLTFVIGALTGFLAT